MRKCLLAIWLIASLLLPPVVTQSQAQIAAPFLLKDINTHTSESSGDFSVLFSGSPSYFFNGSGLWQTDGTPAGTAFIKALSLNYPDLSRGILFGNLLFFGVKYSSTSGGSGFELWKSDGTADGTVRVADLVSGRPDINVDSFQLLDNKLYFLANHSLWCLDVPDAQPILLAGPDDPMTPVSVDSSLFLLGSHLYFSGTDSKFGTELWVSDGTIAGTTYMVDLWPGDGSSNAEPLLTTEDSLLFVANNGSSGWEMWQFQPTSGSIHIVSDVNAIYSNGIQRPQLIGNKVFFTACQQNYDDCHLYYTEGEITHALFEQRPDLAPAMPIPLGVFQTEAGERLLFFGESTNERYDLWATDGSEAGTEILYTSQRPLYGYLWPGNGGLPHGAFFQGHFYFRANETKTGAELWQTDGTLAGTRLFKDIWPGSRSSHPDFLGECGSRFCFTAHDGEHGKELWSTNGTPEQTQLTADLNPGVPSSNPRDLVQFKGQIYFTADDWDHGAGLWKTDGTPEGTQPVWSNPGNPDIAPKYLTVVGDQLFFAQNDLVHGAEVWVTQGTAESTHLVSDLLPGLTGSEPTDLVASGNYLYFIAKDANPGMALWRTDGTNTGTIQLKKITSFYNNGLHGLLAPYRGGVVFNIWNEAQKQTQLWKTDGTLTGTQWIANTGYRNSKMVEANGKLFFTVSVASPGHIEAWQSDGTSFGTYPLPAPGCLGEFHQLDQPVSIGSAVIWIDQDQNQYRILKTKGDSFQCGPAIPIDNGYPYIQTFPTPPSYGKALFELIGGPSKDHTWLTDGTAEGSFILPGDPIVFDIISPVGPLLFFNAYDKESGEGLWMWDGTPAPARKVADIDVTRRDLESSNSIVWNHRLLFFASDGNEPIAGHGTEIWVYDVPFQSVWLPFISH